MKTIKLIITFTIFSFIISPTLASTQEKVSLCTEGDIFQTPNVGGFALTSIHSDAAERAMDWIYSMAAPLGVNVSGGEISMSNDYRYDYLGAVEGTFSLENPSSYTVLNDTPIKVSSPVALEDNYRSEVRGVVDPIYADTHHVRAYLFTDAEYEQSIVTPGTIGADGRWSLDLSPVPINFSGQWRFRLYDISTNTQTGESWPQRDYLENLEIGLYSITDAEYPSLRQSAHPSGEYVFSRSFTGTKRVKLIDNKGNDDQSDDMVLAISTARTGLVRSYELSPGDAGYGTPFQQRSYVYDQALALSAAISLGQNDRAHELARGLMATQKQGGESDGAFYFSTFQLAPQAGDTIFRTGAHAIALYSLLQYIQEYPSHIDINNANASAYQALDYLERMKSTTGPQTGLYLGGSGRYVSDIYEDYIIPWASTEHNLDTWHALKKAGIVLDPRYLQQADDLSDAIVDILWNDDTDRFYQGYGPINPDPADALDTSSWGSMMLAGIYDFKRADSALNRISVYSFTDEETGISGWGPYSDVAGYPGATPTVWYEGSFGVLMAYARNNRPREYATVLADLSRGQLDSGAFRYATDTDLRYEIITAPSVASTAWYILATIGRDSFWRECSFANAPPVSNLYIDSSTDSPNNTKGRKSSRRKGCTDVNALNFTDHQFIVSNNDLCTYDDSVIDIKDPPVKNNVNIIPETKKEFFKNDTEIINTLSLEVASLSLEEKDIIDVVNVVSNESTTTVSTFKHIANELPSDDLNQNDALFDYNPGPIIESSRRIGFWEFLKNLLLSFVANIIHFLN